MIYWYSIWLAGYYTLKNRRGHDRMVLGFTTTYVINVYHH